MNPDGTGPGPGDEVPDTPSASDPSQSAALDRRFQELAALTRQLEIARRENDALRRDQARWQRQAERLNASMDEAAGALSVRLGNALTRLLMHPLTLGRGATILDQVESQRHQLGQ